MAKQTFTTGQVLTAAQMTSLQQTAMLGGAASAKTASYTLVAADAGTAISMSNASATTITVNTALFAAGDTVQITNLGAGVCTITAGTATVNTSASLALAQYESGTLNFTSTSAAIFIKGAAAAAGGGSGLVLVKTQTIGSAVSTITVSDAFSTTYDNYRVIISGGAASTACEINMTLGSTTTNYNVTRYSSVNTDNVIGLNNYDSIGSFAGIFNGSTNSFSGIADISCPYLSKYTSIYGVAQRTDTGRRTYASFDHLANTTSYTAFTLTLTDGATATGGTIKVYGYANS
jgi:hypothetical protein